MDHATAMMEIESARHSRRTAPVCRTASTATGMPAVTETAPAFEDVNVDGMVSEVIRVEMTRGDQVVVWFDGIGYLPAVVVKSVLGRNRGMPRATAQGVTLQRFSCDERRSAEVSGQGTRIHIDQEEYDSLLAVIAWFENRTAN